MLDLQEAHFGEGHRVLVGYDDVIQYSDVQQSQCFDQASRDVSVGRAGLYDPAGVIVGKDDSSSVAVKPFWPLHGDRQQRHLSYPRTSPPRRSVHAGYLESTPETPLGPDRQCADVHLPWPLAGR